MTGFKSGSSDDDPLGGDDEDGDSTIEDTEPEASETADEIVPDMSLSDDLEQQIEEETADLVDNVDTESTSDPETEAGVTPPTPVDRSLPWLYARDSITDGRDRTVQLHLQTETVDRQRAVRSDLEAALGERVQKADLREAALLVGLAHADQLEHVLRTWGYDAE